MSARVARQLSCIRKYYVAMHTVIDTLHFACLCRPKIQLLFDLVQDHLACPGLSELQVPLAMDHKGALGHQVSGPCIVPGIPCLGLLRARFLHMTIYGITYRGQSCRVP